MCPPMAVWESSAHFVGDGNFQVQGAKLGELSLLGGLSKFLKFPELRFTQARAEYKIENGSLKFPELSVIGANSAIRAKGTYAIDRRKLDFSATIYPFMESKSFLQIFNAISAPISAVFRVRLTGSIDKPSWSLAYSPLSIIREGELKAWGSRQARDALPAGQSRSLTGMRNRDPRPVKCVNTVVRNTLPRLGRNA